MRTETMRTLCRFGLLVCLPSLALAELGFKEKVIEADGRPDEAVMVFRFPFTNTGDKPVAIGDISASCGCTVPELEKRNYAPGESGVVTARFTVGDRQGPQTKTVTVRTNEGDYALKFIAKLPVRLQAEPRLLIFKPGSVESQGIHLTFDADSPVTVLGVDSLNPKFHAEIVTLQAGREYTVKVAPAPQTAPAERASIRIRTKGHSGREYTDMVYARFAPQ